MTAYEYVTMACPDCAAEARWYAVGESKPLVHADACPQHDLPLLERTYTMVVPAPEPE